MNLSFWGSVFIGQVIRILTVGFTPKNTSGRNTVNGQIADELNVTGIYSLLRHPLYLGNFFMWLGPVLFLRSFWFTVIFGLLYWLYYERIMFAEEQFLRRKFGEIYDKWSETVSSFIPVHLNYIPPKLPFSVRNVLKREYNSFVNIFVIFTLLDLFRNYFLSGRIYLTGMWMYLSASAFVIWLLQGQSISGQNGLRWKEGNPLCHCAASPRRGRITPLTAAFEGEKITQLY